MSLKEGRSEPGTTGVSPGRFLPFPVISISEVWLCGLFFPTPALPVGNLSTCCSHCLMALGLQVLILLDPPWDGNPVVRQRQGPAPCPRLLQGKERSGGCPSWKRTLRSRIILFPTRTLPTAFAMLQERDVDGLQRCFYFTVLSCLPVLPDRPA